MSIAKSPAITHDYPRLPHLTAAQEQDLAARRVAGGPDGLKARDTLVLHNLGLACELAIKHRGRRFAHQMDDLKSVAVDALIGAAETYRPSVSSRGRIVRFSTYAGRLIRAAIWSATIGELATIRIPPATAMAAKYHGDSKFSGSIPAIWDTENFRELARFAEIAGLVHPTGMASSPRDAFSDVPGPEDDGDSADDPDSESVVISDVLGRLEREHPELHRVTELLYLGSGPVRMIDRVKCDMNTSSKQVTVRRDQALRVLRRYLKERGIKDWSGLTGGLPGRRVDCGTAYAREAC